MGVLNDVIQIDKDGNVKYNQWIEWNHFLIPNNIEWLREILRNLMAVFGHCKKCTALDGCYLVKGNMPEQPLHEHYDCKSKNIAFSKVKSKAFAECDIRKFTEYVFTNIEDSKGKIEIFKEMGYSKEDSSYLQQEFCKQALEQYLLGNYKLKTLDAKGQRLAIPTTLKEITFYSGWMLCPEGKIRNTTPFGGRIK